ncbi:MAG: glycosyltransferase [Acetobacteraceae bacterium]|nr:glycosyltransferase [Acetobacteraceae bacterium]
MPATTAVIVAHNSAAVLPQCLAAIGGEVPVIVVDNGSADDSAALAAAAGARVLRPGRNLGFGPGANLGFAEVTTEFGILLNADAVPAPGMFSGLEVAARRFPEAGLLAPAIRGEDGALQFGRRLPFEPGRRDAPVAMPEGDCCAPYVGGSDMFFPMRVFRALGGFNPDIFLYFEDDDICLRVRAAGHSLVHVTSARMDHAGGKSSAPSPRLDWCKAWHQGWSRLHLEAKHRGRGAAWARLARDWPELAVKAALRRGDARHAKWSGRAARMLAWARGVRATDAALDP